MVQSSRPDEPHPAETPSTEVSDLRMLELRLADGRRLFVRAGLLQADQNGNLFLACESMPPPATSPPAEPSVESGPMVIPVVEERLEVGRQKIATGKVRVSVHTQVHNEVVDLPLTHEQVEVERVPVNRPVESPEQVRQEGDTIIVPVMEEELIVQKRLVVREEIRLKTRRTEVHEKQEVALRRQAVSVERTPIEASPSEPTRSHPL